MLYPLIDLRSVAYDLTCFMHNCAWYNLGMSLSVIAVLMVTCFRAYNFESEAMLFSFVAYDLTYFMTVSYVV